MLNKEIRITKGKEYNNIYKYGRKIIGRYIILFYMKNGLSLNRFGIVASKKVGNAVIRNKVKRKVRAAIEQKSFKKNGYDIIIVTRRSLAEAEFKDMQKDFDKILQKAGLC